MRVLVTGATGFVGSHLVDVLLHDGHDVFALVRSIAKADFLEKKGVTLILGSLDSDFNLPPVDAVIHLAGQIKALSNDDFYRTNTEGTKRLLASLQNQKLKKFVFVSSISARGAARFEGDTEGAGPVSHYGKSKAAAEKLVMASRFPVVVFRPPVVYGPRDLETLVFFKFFKKGFFPVPGHAGNRISFIFVEDLARMLSKSLTAGEGPGPFSLSCRREGYGWDEVCHIGQEIQGKKIRLVVVPLWIMAVAAWINQCWFRIVKKEAPILSLDKFQEMKQSNWACYEGRTAPTGLKEGFQKTFAWYEKEKRL